MIKHHITKYKENGKRYAESWLQVKFIGKYFCFCNRKIRID